MLATYSSPKKDCRNSETPTQDTPPSATTTRPKCSDGNCSSYMQPTVYGKFTRSVYELWKTHCGRAGVVKTDHALRRLFGSMGLHPSKAQVHEMLEVARECSGRDPSSELSFGEFCLFTGELKKCYQAQTPPPTNLSKISSDVTSHSNRSERKMSKTFPKYQVFLGGSCNPTTWRKDLAIPFLSRQGISFYNPQVAHWEEALVELEYQAKQNASVLFFVFDSATRNAAAMVEAGYLAGCHRKLVVVINNYSGPGQLINDESISQTEYEELSGGLMMVQDLVERQGIPIFTQLTHALNCTAKMLRENLWPQDLGTADKVQPVKYPHVQLGDKLVKLHDAFVNINSNRISLAEANVVFKVVTNREFTKEELKTIVSSKNGVNVQEVTGLELSLQDIHLTFQEFCCIVAEFENQPLESRKIWDLLTQSLVSPVQKLVDWALPRQQSRVNLNNQGSRDVYLGGTLGPRVVWRENLAIPLLRKHGLSYFSPTGSPVGGGGGRLPPMEAAHIEKSRVLLFVITNKTRGLSQMSLAAHYIGLGCNVVLCVQMLTQGAVINGEELTAAAIKDYNRGRSYLIDQANKDRISVFSNIEEAVENAIQKCKGSSSR